MEPTFSQYIEQVQEAAYWVTQRAWGQYAAAERNHQSKETLAKLHATFEERARAEILVGTKVAQLRAAIAASEVTA